MNADVMAQVPLVRHFDLIAQAPGGVARLRELILTLAVQGKLVPQDPSDEPASELLKKIGAEKNRLIAEKKIRKGKSLPDIGDDEKFFELPGTWVWVRLNSIGDWGAGATPSRTNSNYYGGKIPWFKSGELTSDHIVESEETITEAALRECSLRLNQPGDVLIAMYGATIGKTAILDVVGTTNQAVCACTPFSGMSNTYLLLLMKALKPYFISQGAGGAQPNISREKIINTVIGLPPLAEQSRIVARVKELMQLCDALEAQGQLEAEQHARLVSTLFDSLLQSDSPEALADNWQRIATHFDLLLDRPDAVDALEQTVLQLAVRGLLVPQDPTDEPASVLLQKIRTEKDHLIAQGKIKRDKPLPPITDEEKPFELPQGWEWARLPDIYFSISPSSNKLLSSAMLAEGKFPVVDQGQKHIAGYTNDEGMMIRVPGPVIVFGDHTKAIKFIDIDFVAGADGTKILRPLCQDERFFAFQLRSFSLEDRGYARHFKVLNSCLFALPPRQEQSRIVTRVTELQALCVELRMRLAASQLAQSHLADALVAQ